jgi:dolichyl-phosphate beta-glucosyltransferase
VSSGVPNCSGDPIDLQVTADKHIRQTNRSLSVVIPAYNEEARIEPTLRTIHEFLMSRNYDGEILVVDDGSKDGTVELVKGLRESIPLLRILSYGCNRGPGHAVRTGILGAAREAILYTDADLSTPIEDVDRLWPWLDEGYDIVIASRHLQHSQLEVRQPFHRRLLGRVFKMLISMLCVRGFLDTQCGFKLFRSKSAHRIFTRVRSRRFTFNVEMLMLARQMGLKVKEVAVRWSDKPGTRISVFRESIRTLAEVLRIRGILPYPSSR